MPIELRCPCGKKLRLKDELAGKKVLCPACRAPLRVAAATPESADAPEGPPAAPRHRKERDAEAAGAGEVAPAKKASPLKWVLLGCGGLLVLGCLGGGGLVVTLVLLGRSQVDPRLVGTWELDHAASSRAGIAISPGEVGMTWDYRADGTATFSLPARDRTRQARWQKVNSAGDGLTIRIDFLDEPEKYQVGEITFLDANTMKTDWPLGVFRRKT